MKTIKTNVLKKIARPLIIALALILNIQVHSQNLQLGLAACWPFDCDNAADVTGNGHDGVTINVSCTQGHAGPSSQGYHFSGNTSSYIEVSSAPRLRPTGPTNPNAISYSGWVNTVDETVDQHIVFTWNGCPNYHEGYVLAINAKPGGGNCFAVVKSDGCNSTDQVVLFGSTAITNSQWYHVGFVVTLDSLKLYVDGVLDGTLAHTKNFLYSTVTPTNVFFGGTTLGFNLPFEGDMDNFRAYDRKLSGAEFLALYNLDPDCDQCGMESFLTNLQACYPFNCDTINYAPTAGTGSSMNGTRFSPATVTCAVGHTGVANTAYRFTGSVNSYMSLTNDSRIKPSAVTVAFWVKVDNIATFQYIIFAHNGCVSYHEGYTVGASNAGSGNITFQAVKASACNQPSQIVLNSSAVSASVWHCVVAYFDASGIKLWVDSSPFSTTGGGALLYGSAPVLLGGTNLAFNYPLDGRIDDLRIYDRELTQGEVNIFCTLNPSCTEDWCRNDTRPGNATGMINIQNETNKVFVYPNPATGKFYVRNSYNKRVVVSDITGKLVSFTTSKVDEKTLEVTLPEQCHGVYFVKLYDADGTNTHTQKIIIQK